MQVRQMDREQYFSEQSYTTQQYIIPYINDVMTINSNSQVVEIGCGEGGNLKPFLDIGCRVVGIDLSEWKIKLSKQFYEQHPLKDNLQLVNEDAFNEHAFLGLKYDLIIMRDTLEHIPNQDYLMKYLKQFLKTNGKIFIAFPAWRMPFGGHQQMCKSALSYFPYFHILPCRLYRKVLIAFGESEGLINCLLSIKNTKVSINQFHKYISKHNYTIEKQMYYLINPNYEIKFKLKPKNLPVFLNIPHLRDYFITTAYFMISAN